MTVQNPTEQSNSPAPSQFAIWLAFGSLQFGVSYGALLAILAFLGSLQLPMTLCYL
jgi:hypothetical protein